MKEIFILIAPKFASAACGGWTASEPHNGTFNGIRQAVDKLIDACPEHPVIERVSFSHSDLGED